MSDHVSQKERQLLTRLSIGLIFAWLVGDVFVFNKYASSLEEAQKDSADRVRNVENIERKRGIQEDAYGDPLTRYSSEVPRHSVAVLENFHEKFAVLFRLAGAAGLALFILVGAFGGWLARLEEESTLGWLATVLLLASASVFAVAEIVAISNSAIAEVPREFTDDEIAMDRRSRAFVHPMYDNHPSRLRHGVILGNERKEKIDVIRVHPEMVERVMFVRICALLLGTASVVLGIPYLLRMGGESEDESDKNMAETHVADEVKQDNP